MQCDVCEGSGHTLVSGRTAVPGCVVGRVKIVIDPADFAGVIEGDIVVTTMTSPESTIALARAAGVVTDRGGILCHAAIVSRELGVPCVVGTNDGTSALENGAVVRLCATLGRVVEFPTSEEGN